MDIRSLSADPSIRDALARLLIETVAHGGSVSFMHPLSMEDARAFWEGSLAAAGKGERIVLGAFEGEALLGTVTLVLACPPNQPHRAEIAKMMTANDRRGRGVGSALLREAERLAVHHGKWLLVLDTARDEGAAPYYEKHGYIRAGEIPDFAYMPHGGLTGTILFWKRLALP